MGDTMNTFRILITIFLILFLSLMTLIIICSCILAKRTDEQKEKLLEKK